MIVIPAKAGIQAWAPAFAGVTSKRGQSLFTGRAELAPLDSYLYWHARSAEDPACRWMKDMLLKTLGTGP
jgi:hypothetical protein